MPPGTPSRRRSRPSSSRTCSISQDWRSSIVNSTHSPTPYSMDCPQPPPMKQQAEARRPSPHFNKEAELPKKLIAGPITGPSTKNTKSVPVPTPIESRLPLIFRSLTRLRYTPPRPYRPIPNSNDLCRSLKTTSISLRSRINAPPPPKKQDPAVIPSPLSFSRFFFLPYFYLLSL